MQEALKEIKEYSEFMSELGLNEKYLRLIKALGAEVKRLKQENYQLLASLSIERANKAKVKGKGKRKKDEEEDWSFLA